MNRERFVLPEGDTYYCALSSVAVTVLVACFYLRSMHIGLRYNVLGAFWENCVKGILASSVCPSVHMEQLGYHLTDLMKYDTFEYFF